MANYTLNVVKMWSLIGTIKKPNLMAAIFNLHTHKVKEANSENLSSNNLAVLNLAMQLRNFETKSRDLQGWKETPLVYEALISGLLYQTACRFTGKGSGLLLSKVEGLRDLISRVKLKGQLNELGLLKLSFDESHRLIIFHDSICKIFLGITTLSLASPAEAMMNWVLSNRSSFKDVDGLDFTTVVSNDARLDPTSGQSNNLESQFMQTFIDNSANSDLNWDINQWKKFKQSIMDGKTSFGGIDSNSSLFSIYKND